MEIFTVGDDKRLSFAKEALLLEAGDVPCRVHLLPIPSSRDGVHITGTEALLADYLSGACEGETVVCYGLAEESIEALIVRGISVIDLAKDEDYIDEGAYLTAVATVGYLLKEARLSPSAGSTMNHRFSGRVKVATGSLTMMRFSRRGLLKYLT